MGEVNDANRGGTKKVWLPTEKEDSPRKPTTLRKTHTRSHRHMGSNRTMTEQDAAFLHAANSVRRKKAYKPVLTKEQKWTQKAIAKQDSFFGHLFSMCGSAEQVKPTVVKKQTSVRCVRKKQQQKFKHSFNERLRIDSPISLNANAGSLYGRNPSLRTQSRCNSPALSPLNMS